MANAKQTELCLGFNFFAAKKITNMYVNKLKAEYKKLLSLEDSDDGIFDFKEMLLQSDIEEVLEFHLGIIESCKDPYLKAQLFSFFTDRSDTNKVSDFLYKKYKSGTGTISTKADIIQLLGHLRSSTAKEVALENITTKKQEDLRYRSIIVLGWVGNGSDIKILAERLLNDPDEQLRGYAATAMRQIWYNHSKAKEMILKNLKEAIVKEDQKKALEGIIIVAQELLKEKLGLKESGTGSVTGDVAAAKIKAIAALNKY